MDIFLTISYLLGCAICCIMAVKDFKRNIPAYQNNKIRILLYTVLFMVVVLVVYIGLLDVLVGISPILEWPYLKTTEGTDGFREYRKIAPILLAILYFGASKASIKVGGKDYAFYEKLLQVFSGFLTIPVGKELLMRELQDRQIESLEDFCRGSADASENFVSQYSEDLNKLEEHKRVLKQHEERIDLLEEMKREDETTDAALMRFRQETDNTRSIYLEQLKETAGKIIESNTSDPIFAEFAINYFQISPMERKNPKVSFSTLLVRTMAFALLGALGIASAIETEAYDFAFVPRVFLISVGLFFFLFLFLWMDRYTWSKDGTCRVLLTGTAAGIIGAVAFQMFDPGPNLIGKLLNAFFSEEQGAILDELASTGRALNIDEMFTGAIMGASSGMIVFIFRYQIVKRIGNLILVFVLLAICGFAFFFVGGYLWSLISPVAEGANLPDAIIVGILCIVVAMVSNVLHLERGLIDGQSTNDNEPED